MKNLRIRPALVLLAICGLAFVGCATTSVYSSLDKYSDELVTVRISDSGLVGPVWEIFFNTYGGDVTQFVLDNSLELAVATCGGSEEPIVVNVDKVEKATFTLVGVAYELLITYRCPR